jgi:hypothetical protein
VVTFSESGDACLSCLPHESNRDTSGPGTVHCWRVSRYFVNVLFQFVIQSSWSVPQEAAIRIGC